MDDFWAHGLVAFLTPFAWAMILIPLAKKFNKNWLPYWVGALLLSLAVMVVKELGDQYISRNDIVADLAGLFFGTALLSTCFNSGHNLFEAKADRSGQGRSFYQTLFLPKISPVGSGVSLREVLLIGLNLACFGARFYTRIAGQIKDQQARQLCLDLAYDQQRQAQRLSSILQEWLPKAVRPSLMEWAQVFVFKQDLYTRKFDPDVSKKEILRYAISCDDKMRKVYGHFRGYFSESWKRIQLDELIEFQMARKDRLESILQELSLRR